MTEAVKDLKDLGEAVSEEKTETVKAEPKKDEFGRSYGTGRRKDAVARVWIKPGKGNVTVNGRDQSVYFARPTQRLMLFVLLRAVVCLVKLVRYVTVFLVRSLISSLSYVAY